VFCNKIETCRKVENMLNRRGEAGTLVLPYHAAIEDASRTKNLKVGLPHPPNNHNVCTQVLKVPPPHHTHIRVTNAATFAAVEMT
jgi:hypothetical protein